MKKILIVDDDKNMHIIYKDLFRATKEKYDVIFAVNVEKAIDKLNETKFNLVVLDIVMGPLSGQYLFLKLRGDENFKKDMIPVIVVSVLEGKDLRFLENSQNTRIFQKPLDKDSFFGAISEMLPA